MTRIDRQVAYVSDDLVHTAREKGMTNFSGFVRAKLLEYINTGAQPSTANTPAAAPIKEDV